MSAPSTTDRLSFTVFLAIALHAMVIFGISFSIARSDKVAPTLNITLATHASAQAPEKADFLAQNNQKASGTEAQVKELTTTEVAQVADVQINEVNPVPVQQAREFVEQKEEVLSTINDSVRKLNSQEKVNDLQDQQHGQELNTQDEARTRKLASLQAKLDQQRQALAREPRVTRHTSVSAKSSIEAAYYNKWSQKIVRVGNLNFPQEALRDEIFGQLRLSVQLRSDGSVAKVAILESSGHAILDDAALRIVRLAAPFEPFPPEIEKDSDIFEIIRTWKFEITGLSASID